MNAHPIVLASSSIYRRALLQHFFDHFECHSPDIDETLLAGETANTYVARLSLEKAMAVKASHAGAIIIASDQCATLDGQILGKPGTHENAVKQLNACSGKQVNFHTGLAVLNPSGENQPVSVSHTCVHFRQLSEDEIERYLLREQPYDCAGSFKSEALGSSLFTAIKGDDPQALIGLPMIQLARMLRDIGIALP